jgi:uncharacterized protein YciI
MDRFADRLIARGPTLARDRDTWTGSLHIVDLPGPAEARAFVEREPYHRAGLFESHVIRRFDNLLGRTMWEFPAESVDARFLVFAHAERLTVPPDERLIVHGALSTPEEGTPAGVVLAVQAPTAEAVRALLGVGPDEDVEIHDWEFGGRR